ncbi:SDR family oxidoreductase [Robertkochia aurantiaca]|uniref:SDR family oxidoreductase n=1 Tax=Robertkochia aurantiaca TaxID=2873700 RepID=UPI001CCD283F|nr:SDR family oxidoreductase [Robertkochia sp. 3YJGBD-33]
MHISLKNKRALIGGSSRGIGEGIARQLAESGASVTLMARDEEKMKALLNELPAGESQKHQYLVIDLQNQKRYEMILSEYVTDNPIDILVNNTPGPAPGYVSEKVTEDYEEAFSLLFSSVVRATRLVLPHMQKQKWGRIINVTSVTIKEPKPELVLSNTIRSSIITWAKSLSQETGKDGITVNNILTGYFDTERLEAVNEKKAERSGKSMEELEKEMAESNAVKRIGKPIEYGYLVAFLASDQAAYLTGNSIPLDGGYLRSVL